MFLECLPAAGGPARGILLERGRLSFSRCVGNTRGKDVPSRETRASACGSPPATRGFHVVSWKIRGLGTGWDSTTQYSLINRERIVRIVGLVYVEEFLFYGELWKP